MTILVQKYGGSSLADSDAVRHVAERVVQARREGHAMVVVVSAMGDTTEDLLTLSRSVAAHPACRELDLLLSTGELVSAALLALALQEMGEEAIALTADQCGILTTDVHLNARIVEIRAARVRHELTAGRIVVVPGFQGTSKDGERTTLGRGGSDTTAVALAAALGAERCEIYTDVDGVFSADPRVVADGRQIPDLPYVVMQEMAWQGAKVFKAEAAEFARSNGVGTVVRSTWLETGGTHLLADDSPWLPRQPAVAGVAGRKDLVGLRVPALARDGAQGAELLEAIRHYDLVFAGMRHGSEMQIYISDIELPDLDALRRSLDRRPARIDAHLGAVSLVGFGIGSRPDALICAVDLLRGAGVNVVDLFTGRESLCFVLPRSEVDDATRRLHAAFVERSAREENTSPDRSAAVEGLAP